MTNPMTRRIFLDGILAMTLGLLSRQQRSYICSQIKFDASSQNSLTRLTDPQVNLITGEMIGLVNFN